MEIKDPKVAKEFFGVVFKMKRLPILDRDYEEVCEREMRAYMLKTEAEFQSLAMKKYQDEIGAKSESSIKLNRRSGLSTAKTFAQSSNDSSIKSPAA